MWAEGLSTTDRPQKKKKKKKKKKRKKKKKKKKKKKMKKKLNAPVEKRTRYQSNPRNPAHSTTKQGSTYGPLACPSKPSFGVCRRSVPDIRECGTLGREDLVDATITSNVEEEN